MGKKLFADSLFVSYINGTPSSERIPYVSETALTQEILEQLLSQISSGCVRMVQLDDATGENSLVADFRNGWATVYIVKEAENYYELLNEQYADDETLLDITGNGPTAKKHATEEMALMEKIISRFAMNGELDPSCSWEHTVH